MSRLELWSDETQAALCCRSLTLHACFKACDCEAFPARVLADGAWARPCSEWSILFAIFLSLICFAVWP